MDHRYIVVEGPIGVGKTSLTQLLAERLSAKRVLEQVEENPFLERFYQDRQQHAFQTQLFFLLSRYRQQQQLGQQDLFRKGMVSDYLFAKDRIFASLNLDENELALYERVYEALGPRIPKPDLVIYLQGRLEVLLGRIKRRGRDYERKFDGEYLEQVLHAYNQYFFHYADTPLLVINTSEIDFVNNPDDFEHLMGVIRKMKKGTHHYLPLATTPGGLAE
ncbi:MAG: deoxynucleoside kinase [Myxococcaceae bacterium]